MARTLDRWVAFGCLVAGVVWLVVWRHQQLAHGATQTNEMILVAGLTWMDSGKILVAPLLLVLIALVRLRDRQHDPTPRATLIAGLACTSLVVLALATALEFWIFPWGTYERTYEEAAGYAGSNVSGGVQSVVSLVFAVSLIPFCVDLVRARILPVWVAVTLPVGGLSTVYLSPSLWLPGLVWLVLGAALWTQPQLSPDAAL